MKRMVDAVAAAVAAKEIMGKPVFRENGEMGDECTSNSLTSTIPVRQLSLLRLLQLCCALSLDPRPVKCAMLNQEGVLLCPAPDPRSVRALPSQITGLGVRRFLGDRASVDSCSGCFLFF